MVHMPVFVFSFSFDSLRPFGQTTLCQTLRQNIRRSADTYKIVECVIKSANQPLAQKSAFHPSTIISSRRTPLICEIKLLLRKAMHYNFGTHVVIIKVHSMNNGHCHPLIPPPRRVTPGSVHCSGFSRRRFTCSSIIIDARISDPMI